jgi:hypothetical protein
MVLELNIPASQMKILIFPILFSPGLHAALILLPAMVFLLNPELLSNFHPCISIALYVFVPLLRLRSILVQPVISNLTRRQKEQLWLWRYSQF